VVLSGRLYLGPDIAQELEVQSLPGRSNPMQALSAREFEVFRLLVDGHTVADIARVMCLSPKTVANYQSALRHKLEVSNTTQAVRLAMAHGLVAGVSAEDGDTPSS
jgi:DNA-binding NarL/FixJ family response regulator